MDRHEFFAAMAHFHHAHATALPIEHLVGCLTQHCFGHGRWAGGEIKDAHREILEAGAKNEQIAQKSAKLAAAKAAAASAAAAKLAPRTRQREFNDACLTTRIWQRAFGNIFAPKKKMAVCACAQTAIIALSPPTRQTRHAAQHAV
ncbi:hypothetical protein [Paraburkholderia elongata]|uniref:hypothetical protein n=1 Tax=Paraburkholderia elongata TaxID=2675747 RepID=UPI001F43F86F|nr:hypothetical protein [Paraburkholderia elongata]